MTRTTRAVLYSRVSTMAQSEFGVSLEMQEQMAREYCERQGWVFTGLYTDTESGRKHERVQLAALEADAAGRRFDVVLVYKTDRLARSLLKLLQVAADLHDRGVSLVSLTEPIDFTTPMGKGMLALLGTFGEMEAQNISQRTRDGLRQVASRGDKTGATLRLLGYRWDDEQGGLVCIPSEVEAARMVFACYLEARTYRGAAVALNERGYRTYEGRTFSARAVRDIVSNPAYRGALAYGRNKIVKNSKGKQKRQAIPVERWIVKENAHEAIVDADIWRRVQEARGDSRRVSPREVYARTVNAWAGLLVCSACGARMNARPREIGGKSFSTYTCTNRSQRGAAACVGVNTSDSYLDLVVVPAIAARLRELTGDRPGKKRRALRVVDSSRGIDEARAEIERAWVLVARGKLTEAAAERIEAEAKARIESLSRPGDKIEPMPVPPLLGDLAGLWPGLEPAERGRLLRLAVERVEVGPSVSVRFHEALGAEPLALSLINMASSEGRRLRAAARTE